MATLTIKLIGAITERKMKAGQTRFVCHSFTSDDCIVEVSANTKLPNMKSGDFEALSRFGTTTGSMLPGNVSLDVWVDGKTNVS